MTSRIQEAMWETKYNEILAITSQKDEEMEVLESSQEKERQSSANVGTIYKCSLFHGLWYRITVICLYV